MEENNTWLFKEEEAYDSKSGKGFKRIFKNFSFLTFGKLSGDFFNLILFVILSREFGQEGIGKYSFAFGFTSFFAVLADFGLYNYSIREISRNKDSTAQHYLEIFSLRLVLATLILIALFLITTFLDFDYESKLIIVIIGSYQIIYELIDGLAGVFIAHENMLAAGIIASSSKILTSAAGILVAFITENLVFTLLSFPIISIFQLLVLILIYQRRFGNLKITLSSRVLRSTFKKVLPFGIKDFLATIYSRIDVVLIGFVVGETASGIYNVGYRAIFFLLFIPNFAGTSIFPIISRMFYDSKFEFRKMYNKSLNMMVIIGLPVSAGLWLIAPQLIEKIFGSNFIESALILRILAAIFFIKCISKTMAVFMMSSDKQKEYAKAQFMATVFSFVANFVLIFLYGPIGAAIATVLSGLLLSIIYLFKLKTVVRIPDIKNRLLISLLGIASFCLPFSFFPSLSIFVIIPSSILIYLGIILSFKEVRENEVKMFLRLFGLINEEME